MHPLLYAGPALVAFRAVTLASRGRQPIGFATVAGAIAAGVALGLLGFPSISTGTIIAACALSLALDVYAARWRAARGGRALSAARLIGVVVFAFIAASWLSLSIVASSPVFQIIGWAALGYTAWRAIRPNSSTGSPPGKEPRDDRDRR